MSFAIGRGSKIHRRGPVEHYVDEGFPVDEQGLQARDTGAITGEMYVTELDDHPIYPKGSMCLSGKSLLSRVEIPTTRNFCVVLTPSQVDQLIGWLTPEPTKLDAETDEG